MIVISPNSGKEGASALLSVGLKGEAIASEIKARCSGEGRREALLVR
jgi:hypothetical protein